MNEWFWHFLIACYFIGGLGIGYLANEYRHKEKRTGKEYEWDYKDRHLP